jgi:hypothetical protein
MNLFLSDLILIRKQTLAALKALEGIHWQEVSGELHYQYKEMPNWITIMADGPNSTGIQRAFFDMNEDIKSALSNPDFGNK